MIRFSRAAAVAFVVIAFIVLGLTRFKCALFQVQATGGLPSLKYSGSQHLGEHDLGDVAECPVVLTNTGGAPLRIFDIVRTVYDIICTARSWRSSPFTLVAPSELPPGLEARLLSRDSAGSVQKIQICVSPELRKTGIRETLEFTATVDGRELRVPVTVSVLPPRFEP